MTMDVSQLQALLNQENNISYALHKMQSYIPSTDHAIQPSIGTKDKDKDKDARDKKENNKSEITQEQWRLKITEWAFEVVDHFDFQREVVSIALNYIDRYMAVRHALRMSVGLFDYKSHKVDFQLLAMTSLYLAIKLHGQACQYGMRNRLKIQVFAHLSRGQFTVKDIEQMEVKLLTQLRWLVHPPISANFLIHILDLFPKHDGTKQMLSQVFELSRYLTELSACVSEFSFQFKSSAAAFAAILATLDVMTHHDDNWSPPSPTSLNIFFRNVYEITGMLPNDAAVESCRSKLLQLCPPVLHLPGILEVQTAPKTPSVLTRESAVVSPCSCPTNENENEVIERPSRGRKRSLSATSSY